MMDTKMFCLCLDLKNNQQLIAEYERMHKEVWQEVKNSIKESGIITMEIFRWENRLFMILITERDFSFEKKAEKDHNNPKIMEWEDLMWNFQQALPGTKEGEKWQLMSKIFDLKSG